MDVLKAWWQFYHAFGGVLLAVGGFLLPLRGRIWQGDLFWALRALIWRWAVSFWRQAAFSWQLRGLIWVGP